MKITRVREYDALPDLTGEEIKTCHSYIADSDGPPLLRHRKKAITVQNYVGILPLKNQLIEIYPKIPLVSQQGDITEDEKIVFYTMLRYWRGLKKHIEEDADINKLKNFSLWEIFITVFLQHTLTLVRRGITSRYQTHTDNLPYLKGRLLFPQHSVINSVNKARFYVQYDTYTPDTAANRLIRTTLDKLFTQRLTGDSERQRRWLIGYFDMMPLSENIDADWQQYRRDRSDRTLQHYKTVMHWVYLILWHYGLTTYSGDTRAPSLLFPMEQVFEDFVSHHIRRRLGGEKDDYKVKTQSPQKNIITHSPKGKMFTMEPDIHLTNKNNDDRFIIDAKWKELVDTQKKYNISQADIYQLYSYGKHYNCKKVLLLYPRNQNFNEPVSLQFSDGLPLLCLPFDLQDPETSTREIRKQLEL